MNRLSVLSIALLGLFFTFSACGGSDSTPAPEDMATTINQYIENDNYAEAIELLNNADPAEVANLALLKEKVHLNYGLYLEYRGGDKDMRDRMTGALRQFIKTLQINEGNDKARAEIEQIMSIYQTMPNKSIPEDIITNLQELGYNYSN
ncbi:MAG: hypothetical protein ACQETE_06410 [Bacteroidota bacterium]